MKLKKCYIRQCDNDFYWVTNSGNSDALCNEDSRNIECALCDKNIDCKYSDFPYFDENNPHRVSMLKYRKKMRNTEVCSRCVYNNEYEWIKLTIKDQRKIKLKILKRNENRG